MRVRWAWPVVFIVTALALVRDSSPAHGEAMGPGHAEVDMIGMREAPMEDEDA